MSELDITTKKFMQNKKHFADAFNYFFRGEISVDHNRLEAIDPTELSVFIRANKTQTVQKYRDILKNAVLMSDGKATYAVLGIENQSNIHYAMTVKSLVYDALNYDRQVSNISESHKRNKDVSGDEYLSGFTKYDKLMPVITLTVYFGKEEWDAPRTLFQMLDTDDKNVLKYCNDYKNNIIIPKEIEDFSLFKTDLKNVLQMIAVSDNNELYSKALNEDESYTKVPVLTAQLIKQTAGIQLDIPKGKKVINMCLAQELLRQEAIDEGIEKGKKQGLEQGLEQGKKQTFLDLLRKNIITVSVAAKELGMDEEEINKLL